MTEFNTEKLHVTYKGKCDEYGPLDGRRYSLSHSDETGDLFLSIGLKFYYFDNQTVLAELSESMGGYTFEVYVKLDDESYEIQNTKKRNEIFRSHLNLAITAMIYGDKKFLTYNDLLDYFVIVHFESRYSKYNVVEQWGRIKKYLL